MKLRIDVTLPNLLSAQSVNELSNMAMPVADSTRGYGFWPKTTTFALLIYRAAQAPTSH